MIISQIVEEIMAEAKKRTPDTKITSIIMNDILHDLHVDLHEEFSDRIRKEILQLFADKKVTIAGTTLEFDEREPCQNSA